MVIDVFSDAATSDIHKLSTWAVVVEYASDDGWLQHTRVGWLPTGSILTAELVAAVVGVQWAQRWNPSHIQLIVDRRDFVGFNHKIRNRAAVSTRAMFKKLHAWQSTGWVTIKWYPRQTRAGHKKAHTLAHQRLVAITRFKQFDSK